MHVRLCAVHGAVPRVDCALDVAAPAESRQSMTPLKAFIVEDSPVIRENLVAALEEMAPIEVVGTAEDEASAVRWLGDRTTATSRSSTSSSRAAPGSAC